jgi:pantoate--beta-alanine ligase
LKTNTETDGPTADRPQLVADVAELRTVIGNVRATGQRIGLVPTMGALHEGHLSLVRTSRSDCDYTVVTVFVNPTQFGPHEDFKRYPRTLDADLAALAEYGVDLVFAPTSDAMYPQGSSTFIETPQVAKTLEGQCRPGHFRGVATVVLKLFNLVQAHISYFGQKDYQQCLVIRRMVDDLNVPIAIRMCPIVREADGLAMSSRNRYLNDQERQQAVAIPRSLQLAEQLVAAGERDTRTIVDAMQRTLDSAGITRVDYVAIAGAESLEALSRLDRESVALIAAYVGKTRLIDNHLLSNF